MKKLAIGLDFDGVCANTPRKKAETAAQKFNIYVPMNECNKLGFLKRGITEEQYSGLQAEVYSEYNLRPVQGCQTYVRKIIEDGHDIKIRSYRLEKPGIYIINSFLVDNRLNIDDFLCTNNRSKNKYCDNFDVFIDDKAEHLLDLKKNKCAKHLILFGAPYNKNEELADGMERICGWKNVYEEISKIARK